MMFVSDAFYFRRTSGRLSVVLIALLLSSTVLAQPDLDLWSFWNQADESNAQEVNHQPWADILDEYLDDEDESGVNLFNYSAVDEADHQKLKDYLVSLTQMDPRKLNKNEQFAYWANLYNALTVELILREYPVESITKIKPSFFKFGPWDMEITEIQGQIMTLNDIEHRILRPIWQDHRIHFAVNCASIGCPSLLGQPFLANTLERQLDDAAKGFISHPRGVEFKDGDLVLSEIFDWYQKDFGNNEAQMLKTISQYMPASLLQQVQSYKGRVSYQYNWQLNEPD